ncbi:MAG: hypothetical protein V4773_01160 [Verrucomicrobiota bacterium]
MPSLNFAPAFSLISAFSAAPLRPFHTLVRTTEERFRPSRIAVHRAAPGRAQARMLAAGTAGQHLHATVLHTPGTGRVPTIVLGGFVPDATEQVFLLRRFLLRSGDLYCVSYPVTGFSLDVLCAQLDDLVEELALAGTPPVIFSVSFGAGVVLEWLRRSRAEGRNPVLAGVILVSPVSCTADIIATGAAKPNTLLGRALGPFLDAKRPATEAAVDKARAIFLRMFEAGAQNKLALRMLMTKTEVERLRNAVMNTIRDLTSDGARERIAAMQAMVAPTDYFTPAILPLTTAPTLVLFAEKEEAVLDAASPGRFAFGRACRAFFPDGETHTVKARMGGAPVQHASLIFHVFEFLPRFQAFYNRVRKGPLPLAA